MKKFFTMLTFALAVAVFLPAMTCEAYPRDYDSIDYLGSGPVTWLKSIIGNWYDTKGNLVLSISNDYKINGCTVLGVKAGNVGLTVVKIDEGNRYRTIVWWDTDPHGPYSYPDHHMLYMDLPNDTGYALRRTKEPRYFESVGGIYIGMDKDEVLKLYGQPSSTERHSNFESVWKYNNLGLDLEFGYNVVREITIYPYGDRRFDRSGLSARSSKAEFEYKYGNRVIGDGSMGYIDIGHNEKIEFREDSMILSMSFHI